jgi:hypothetical protein
MNEAKIRLSDSERELVSDAQWILTKNRIMEKGMQLLGQLQPLYAVILNRHQQLPASLLQSSPKISRGENYRGLPWLVLDYPRLFGKEDVLALRTMFWWGHFFSITLQVAGAYQRKFEQKIIGAYPILAKAGYSVCIADDPWQHHFETDHYRPITEIDQEEFTAICQSKDFIKIAIQYPVTAWEEVDEIFVEEFRKLIEMLGA